jgi:hypothetical protein
MSYTYGMKGAPAVGNGLGGLPTKQVALGRQSTYSRIVIDSFTGAGSISGTTAGGTLFPPPNARFMRVAAIGGGGCGYYTGALGYGGGGGGCAATKIIPASTISYIIGAGGDTTTRRGGNTTASFAGYALVGGGGGSTSFTQAGTAGVGLGGDYNYNGGSSINTSSTAGGGGGAGPAGPGGNFGVDPTNGQYIDGWGCGGGSVVGNDNAAGAGANPDQLESNQNYPWGTGQVLNVSTPIRGGELGGGGRSGATTGWATIGRGGSGGLVVEWFY